MLALVPHFISVEPRPYILFSMISPLQGGVIHPSSETGNTSMCPFNTKCRPELTPLIDPIILGIVFCGATQRNGISYFSSSLLMTLAAAVVSPGGLGLAA